MAASKKTTRESRYREILMSDGISFNDCRVLAFVFERPLDAETFHLRLMNADQRPEYHIFDYLGSMAHVVAPNDEQTLVRIQGIAEQMGGKKTTPNLI